MAVVLQWASSRVEPSAPFPPFSLAERLIRVTPGDVATFFIERFEHVALTLLAAGVTVGFLVAGALLPLAGYAAGRLGAFLSAGLFALASVAASFAAPTRPELLPVAAQAAASGLAYGVTLHTLEELAQLYREESVDQGRRGALVWLGGMAALIAAGGTAVGSLLKRMAGPNTDVGIGSPDEPAGLPVRAEFPEVPGLSPEITSAEDHYVVDIDLVDPVVEVDGWTLEIAGEVKRSMELTFEELQRRFALVEEYSVLWETPRAGQPAWIAGVAWAGDPGYRGSRSHSTAAPPGARRD